MVFTGENYNEWSTELVNALRAKRKLGVIDGTIPKPPVNELNFELWSSVNSMIFGWIRTSIESRVRSTVTFISDSHKLWENLKKRFSVGNKVRVHHLKEQIASCKQNSQSMMDYFGWLAKMWEELDMYKPLPACSCNAAAEYEKEREEENAHQFLMGLDESRFGIVCQRWCARNNVSSLLRIVKLRVMLLALLQRRNRRGVPQCAHCGSRGNKKANCWQLVGFPDWWDETPPNRGDNKGGRGRGSSTSDRNRNNGV